jgi:hypothetical protein
MTMPGTTHTAATTAGRERTLAVRERSLSLLGGVLGILMFAFGFLRWLSVGEGNNEHKFSAYALEMPTAAVVGLSLAAGLIALLGATERRPGRGVPSAIPAGLAATGFLLAIGVLLGKGQISPNFGDKVGIEIGLVLGLITAAIQTLVLGLGLASRHDEGIGNESRIGGDSII